MTKKIEGTEEAWDSGQLGTDPKHAKKAKVDNDVVDNAMGLQMISVRLQKTLLEDLKTIANLNGIGYQPLMKQILKRFVDCEFKKMANEYAVEQRKENEALAKIQADELEAENNLKQA